MAQNTHSETTNCRRCSRSQAARCGAALSPSRRCSDTDGGAHPASQVLVVSGVYRGTRGELLDVDVDAFCARVRLLDGPHEGVIVSLQYEHICKTETQ